MATARLSMPLVLIETAPALTALDSGWSPQRHLRFGGFQEGAGAIAGTAIIEQLLGIVRPQYRAGVENIGMAPNVTKSSIGTLAGQFVRLLVQDPQGTIERGNGVYRATYSAQWHGQITGPRVSPDGAGQPVTGGTAAWQAAGIFSLLDQITINRGWVKPVDGANPADPGFMPPFNRLAGGDRSASTVAIDGRDVFIHDLSSVSSGSLWSARNVIDLLLIAAARPTLYGQPRGPKWRVLDPDNCLAFPVPESDFAGMRISQAILTLISAGRGLTFWTTLDRVGLTNFCTIHVRSTVSQSINMGMGNYTLPASSKTTTIDQADGPFIRHLTYTEKHESVYDIIELIGARPWVAVTLSLGTSLRVGWNTELQPTWANNPAWSTVSLVYRRFEVVPDWDGSNYPDVAGLRTWSTVTDSDAHGYGGFNGQRQSFSLLSPAAMLELTAELPVSDGFSILRLGARQKAVIIVGNGTYWEDMSDRWKVSVERDPAAIRIDDGANGAEIADWLAIPEAKLLVTIGVRELLPLKVSWVRPPPLTREAPRIRSETIAAEQWMALGGCVTGVSIAGTALTKIITPVTARDDVPQMLAQLGLERGNYEEPDVEISWEREGIDLGDQWRPGTLITSADLGDRTVQPDAVIVSRAVDKIQRSNGTASYVTRYTAMHVLPGTELRL